MEKFINNEIIGKKKGIFRRMEPENLQACQNSLDVTVPSPEDLIITIEDERESLKDTLFN